MGESGQAGVLGPRLVPRGLPIRGWVQGGRAEQGVQMWRSPTPQEQRGVGQDGCRLGERWVVSVGLSSPTCEMGFSERPVCVQMPAQGLAHQGCPDRGTHRQTDKKETFK